jgi:tRNA pseudouridine55 synthase
MNGILVLNKPRGLSSAEVVAGVKRLLGADKVGHTGTLDPFAQGVLVCCINQATRLARFLADSRKVYEAVLTLGVDTDTQDATGKVVGQREYTGISEALILRIFQRYEGILNQTPPAYSALKHQGVSLYVLARRGRPVQKPPRQVRIFSNRVLAVALPEVRFEVCCSAGTYIRTLSADIGRELGCGGHLSELKRLESGGFTLDQALTLEELKELDRRGAVGGALIPMSRTLTGMPEITASPELIDKIRYGRPLSRDEVGVDGLQNRTAGGRSFIKVLDAGGELVAVLQDRPEAERLHYVCVFARPRR